MYSFSYFIYLFIYLAIHLIILTYVFIFSGFGQPDIFYPKNLEGKWEVEQTYTDISGEKKSLYFIELLSKMQENEKNVNEKDNQNEQNKNKNQEIGGEEKSTIAQNPEIGRAHV